MDETDEYETLESRREEEMRPLREAGQGEAEGFEEAEKDLIEHASHGDSGPDPTNMAGEAEASRPDAAYGDADHVESSEVEDEDEPPEEQAEAEDAQ